jgi:hypothetical protein
VFTYSSSFWDQLFILKVCLFTESIIQKVCLFTERLKKELEWEARELAFSLITKMPDSSTPIFIHALGKGYPERNAKAGGKPGQLGKDKRFVKLLR